MEQVLQQGVLHSTHTVFSPKAKTSRSTDLAACSTQSFGSKPIENLKQKDQLEDL